MKPRHYIQELGEDLDSKKNRKKFKQMLMDDATELLASMGRPDRTRKRYSPQKGDCHDAFQWESLGGKRGRPLDESIWEDFEKQFMNVAT